MLLGKFTYRGLDRHPILLSSPSLISVHQNISLMNLLLVVAGSVCLSSLAFEISASCQSGLE